MKIIKNKNEFPRIKCEKYDYLTHLWVPEFEEIKGATILKVNNTSGYHEKLDFEGNPYYKILLQQNQNTLENIKRVEKVYNHIHMDSFSSRLKKQLKIARLLANRWEEVLPGILNKEFHLELVLSQFNTENEGYILYLHIKH